MPSLINESTQFLDTDGLPIVNGYIYIGAVGTDPTIIANQITIYSDRDLTTTLANPQRTDSSGRAANKIWIPGKYSLTVQDSANAQKLQDLDRGEVAQTGISLLTNTQGTNTITADGAPTITALVDNQCYIFRAAAGNTGAVTLQIDTTTAKTIKKQHDVDLVSGDIEANQTIMVVYNGTDDTFELVSNTLIASLVNLSLSGTLSVTGASTLAAITTSGLLTTTNGQINFPDTQNASSDVNTLDDYEEGSFAATLTCSVGGSITLSTGVNETLYYTKIGDRVHISGRLVVSSVSTPTGTVNLGTLPFTPTDYSSATVHCYNLTGFTGSEVRLVIQNASTSADLHGITGFGLSFDDSAFASRFQNGTNLYIDITYKAS